MTGCVSHHKPMRRGIFKSGLTSADQIVSRGWYGEALAALLLEA
jgi:hypothetical protein